MSAGVPETDHVAFVVLAEVERGLAAGQRCVYPEDVQDATGLTWKQVQAAGADLARVGLVDVVDSAHFGVLRFIGLSDLAAGVVRAVQRAEHDRTTPQPRQRDLDRMWRCPAVSSTSA